MRTRRRSGPSIALATLAVVTISWAMGARFAMAQESPAPAAPSRPGLTAEAIDNLSHKHPGHYGALAPQNLAKKRPKPPFDLTATWFVDLRRSFDDFKFGPPYPQFLEPGQQAMKEAAAASE